MPSTIEQVQRVFAARGLAILAVNIREDRARVARWVAEQGVTTPVLLDRDGSATAAYQVRGTPTVVLVDRNGRMVGLAVGTRDWMGEIGRALLTALLGQPGN